MRIATLSDLHFARFPKNPLRLLPKRFLGCCNWLYQRKRSFSHKPLFELPSLLESLKVEALFLIGDLSNTSMQEEFEQASAWLRSFSVPSFVLPGNHDAYTYKSAKQKLFYRFFSNRPSPLPFRLETDRVEAHPLTPPFWAVSLDTAIPTSLFSSQGLFSKEMESSFSTLLHSLPDEALILLFNHYPLFQNDSKRRSLKRNAQLQSIIQKDPRIVAYFQGHTHRHTIADLSSSHYPLILDGGSASEGFWNLIDLSEKEISIQGYQWKHTWIPFRQETFTLGRSP